MDFKRGLEATRSGLAEFMRDIVFSWIGRQMIPTEDIGGNENGRQMIPKRTLEGTRTDRGEVGTQTMSC